MNINFPAPGQTAALRELWKAAFGDEDAFLDGFFSTAFSPSRCRRIEEAGCILAALYWFDVTCDGKKMAYIYAVATDPAHRGRGLCRRLMEDAKAVLQAQGYAGILLVPCEPGLVCMYAKLGYSPCTTVSVFRCKAGDPPVSLRQIGAGEYARLRAAMLPAGGVIQEGVNLAFLETYTTLYAGENFLTAISMEDDVLHCQELLGDADAAPGILRSLGCREGIFRTPGGDHAFSMICPLNENCPQPAYFGLAFD